MGYRSDIGIICDKAAFNELFKRIKQAKLRTDFFEIGTVNGEEDLYSIYISDVKWYEGFDIVELIRSWRLDCRDTEDDLTENQFHGFIHYVRLGESNEDIEEDSRGSWRDDDMYIERYLNMPDDTKFKVLYPASYDSC